VNDSFSKVLKGFQLPQRGMDDVRAVLLVVLALIVLIVLVYLVHTAAIKKKRRRAILKSARDKKLSKQELRTILGTVNTKPMIDPMKVLSSLREFQRLFGPLMHELVDKMDIDPLARRQLNLIFSMRKKLFGEVTYHFGPLSTTLQLSIGQRLTLKLDYHGRSLTANSIVLDVDSEAITVSSPRLKGKHLRFVKDHPVDVMFFRDKDAEYQFKTLVLRGSETNQPFLLLAHDLNIQRIQSREFYRITARISFKFRRFIWDSQLDNRYLDKGEEQIFGGVIQNISAGGMLFTTEAKLDKNDILVFSLQLGPELILSDLLGKVLNINQLPQREEKFQVHIRFINIKVAEQDQIIRMILQDKVKSKGEEQVE
jgi:c-di-GMP-binding flagellar brake protein YcgR